MVLVMYSPFYWDVEVVSVSWNTATVKIPKKIWLTMLYKDRDTYLDFVRDESIAIKKKREKMANKNRKLINF